MAARLISSFVLVSSFFFCSSFPLHSETACPLFQCGNLSTIYFPFFNDEDFPNWGLRCGLVSIKCSDDLLKISSNYVIKNISYDEKSLLLQDWHLLHQLQQGGCSLDDLFETPESAILGGPTLNLFHCNLNEYNSSEWPIKEYYNYTSCQGNEVLFFTEKEMIPTPSNGCTRRHQLPIQPSSSKSYRNDNLLSIVEAGFTHSWEISPSCISDCRPNNRPCDLEKNRTTWNFTCPAVPQKEVVPPQKAAVPQKEGRKKTNSIVWKGVLAGVGGFFLLLLLSLYLYCYARNIPPPTPISFQKKRTTKAHNVEGFLQSCGSHAPKRYCYSDLKKITDSFKDKLGQGGYGSVFKGKLNYGRVVAVKVLNNSKGNGEEFINEVASIGRTYHINIVRLLGFCSEGSKRALIYEFMPNGSLEKFIFSQSAATKHALGFEKLFQIAIGIARGLEYLHRGCSMRILHFDIKPHNILLDDDFCPKIADFGLAKICPGQESVISMTNARGTVGYIAPEVFCRNIGSVSHKSDVYSYGMMILEMVGGRKNIDALVENTSEVYFPHWVYHRIIQKENLKIFEISTAAEEITVQKMILVGLWCIQTDPANRPSISKVVEMLEGNLENLQMPPKPYLSSPVLKHNCSAFQYPVSNWLMDPYGSKQQDLWTLLAPGFGLVWQRLDLYRHQHEINLANLAINMLYNQELHELINPRLEFQLDSSVGRMITPDFHLVRPRFPFLGWH